MSNFSERENLEQLILNTIKTKTLDRFTLIENNLSFKKKAILINERYNKIWNVILCERASFQPETLSIAHKFLEFIDSIPDSECDFYLSCVLLLTDFLNTSKSQLQLYI